MTKALSPASITALLNQVQGNILSDLLAEVDTAAAIEKKGSNVGLRKAAHRTALAENNKIELAKVAEAAADHLPVGKEVVSFADEAIESGLDEKQAVVVMKSVLGGKLLGESIDALYELSKQMVFRSMDIAFAEEEFPEHTNGVLDVPELGKRFCREAAGRKPATLDEKKLVELIGEELFSEITTEVVTRKVDPEKLAAAALANPTLLEQVRSAVKPGDWKSPRLMVRDIPADEKE